MNLTPNALTVLEKRYLAKDENQKPIETPQQLFERVAHAIAVADLQYDKKADVEKTERAFYDMMTNLEFLPNSPTLMNAGRPLGQLSACFVLPVGDSMEEIFDAVKNAAIIHKSGGGTGFSFSRLRPGGATVNSTGGVASGPISFMKVFNAATEAVKQGGTRRGANMGILRVDHPDIEAFIDCKSNNAEITNFNISVGITEEFMKRVEENGTYALIDPHSKKEVKRLPAREVFNKIVDSAWRNGEPGIIFLDRLNRDNVIPDVCEFEATNPCGEQPLLPYESCNLGSVNLCAMLKQGRSGTEIDFDKLEKTVKLAVHFLDNVIDVNRYPLEIIDKTTKDTRKIGLGVMGFGDMLYSLGIPYNSQAGVDTAERVMGFVQTCAKEASLALGKERGVFPLFDQSVYAGTDQRYRNATVTTIAPTGTLSIFAGVSSGVEPIFALAFIRNVMDNTEMIETNPVFRRVLEERGLYSEELMKQVAETGNLSETDLPQDLKDIFVTSHDVSPEWHIKMQATFQKYTDNAVSKTINFKESATREDIYSAYMLAYGLGCKGITVYRDKSRDMQVLNIGKVHGKEEAETGSTIVPRPRPDVTTGFTEKVKIGCGNLYITVNYDENGICEVFTNTGRGGGCPSQSEATSRLVSIALRSGMDVDVLVEQLRGIRCPTTMRKKDLNVTSCPDAISKVIQKVAKAQSLGAALTVPSIAEETMRKDDKYEKNGKLCPECHNPMEHEGGCTTCRHCGYSKCG